MHYLSHAADFALTVFCIRFDLKIKTFPIKLNPVFANFTIDDPIHGA